MADFLPRSEEKLIQFSGYFSDKLSESPEALGFTPEQAAQYAALRQSAVEAMDRVNSPTTDSTSNRFAKRAVLAELRSATRALVRQIRANPDVTQEQQFLLGLPVITGARSSIKVPMGKPAVFIREMSGRTVRVRVTPSAMDFARRLPAGAIGAVVLMCTGEKPAATREGWSWVRNVSRTDFDVQLPHHLPGGTRVWLTACWYNARAEVGRFAEARDVVLSYVTGPASFSNEMRAAA